MTRFLLTTPFTLQGAWRDPRMDYAEDEELHVFIQGDAQEGVRFAVSTCMKCALSFAAALHSWELMELAWAAVVCATRSVSMCWQE